jgi:integrase
MKKVSEIFKRKDRAGFWIRWTENGKRKFKQFNTKSEAEHYRHLQYMKLNSDVYTNISLPFDDAKDEYLLKYDLQNLSDHTKKQAEKTINNFFEIARPLKTSDINQKSFDYFIITRKGRDVSAWSVNREARALMAFITFLNKKGYLQTKIEFQKLKTDPPKSKALSDGQIKALLAACVSPEWRLRVVLALVTGLRKEDLYKLPVNDIDFKEKWIGTKEVKTRKYYSGPLPDGLMSHLSKYSNGLPKDRKFFFKVYGTHWLDKQFRKFRPEEKITIQSLRKTFATRIETTSISTAMLNHSSKALTRTFYTDMDYIKYIRINQLPIKAWLA